MVPAIGPGRSHWGRSILRARGPHRWCGPLAPPRRLETADAVRRTEARGAVVAGLGGTEVAAHRARREVRSLSDVEEARRVAVRIRPVHQGFALPASAYTLAVTGELMLVPATTPQPPISGDES